MALALVSAPRVNREHQAILAASTSQEDSRGPAWPPQDLPPTHLLPHGPEHRLWLWKLPWCWVLGSAVSNAIWVPFFSGFVAQLGRLGGDEEGFLGKGAARQGGVGQREGDRLGTGIQRKASQGRGRARPCGWRVRL